jgi:ATP-binding protein involved in chromosome partitioning
VPLLGQVPLDVALREAGDSGTPVVLADPSSAGAVALREVARSITSRRRGLAGKALGLTPVGR